MSDGISVIDISAGVLEEIEEEDERSGWSDGPDAVLSPAERVAFEGLVRAYRMPW